MVFSGIFLNCIFLTFLVHISYFQNSKYISHLKKCTLKSNSLCLPSCLGGQLLTPRNSRCTPGQGGGWLGPAPLEGRPHPHRNNIMESSLPAYCGATLPFLQTTEVTNKHSLSFIRFTSRYKFQNHSLCPQALTSIIYLMCRGQTQPPHMLLCSGHSGSHPNQHQVLFCKAVSTLQGAKGGERENCHEEIAFHNLSRLMVFKTGFHKFCF